MHLPESVRARNVVSRKEKKSLEFCDPVRVKMSGEENSPEDSSGEFADYIELVVDANASSADSLSDMEVESQDQSESFRGLHFRSTNKEAKRKLRRLLQKEARETEASTSEGSMIQSAHALSSMEVDGCLHPGSMEGICITCGQNLPGKYGLTVGYMQKIWIVVLTACRYFRIPGLMVLIDLDQKGLRLEGDEMSRLSSRTMKSLLNHRKLCLVLDLDHTLLNTTSLFWLTSEEMALNTNAGSLQDVSKGSLFISESMNLMTKLRPFVRTFLKEASEMFEMYIYTMGDRPYAIQMAKLLDPQEEYFKDKIISRDDGTKKDKKDLDIVMGTENAILILDDKEEVWPNHNDNLMLMERYLFFKSSCQEFGYKFKSLTELQSDEDETNGALSKILKVLKQIHSAFFDELQGDLIDRDVRQVLSSLRGEVLSGCVIVFSHNFRSDLRPLKNMARRLGATCYTNPDATVTHVVATEFVTKETRWATQHNKFLVSRHWLEASHIFFQKQPEENFILRQRQ
ncbi:RNA polymerase II C-terminal domain phosphatase-like 4 [Trifolium pratense]|uniref:RNA polymerase II C-terminal domain phosphatase-like 4 n=1 Tax=Trifolium pratense TaxID=57577 RepID=UPI001E696A64|nr:RNA polymerase II C-terminal domain phosphatase-like 4 [Trifolium pratense]